MKLIPEYTVSELVKSIKMILEGALYYVKVTGEVSNTKVSSAGHVYFSLRDTDSTINAVFFAGSRNNSGFRLEDGLMIVLYGRLTIYESRSVYQIIAENLEIGGIGSLLRLIEERKNKLKAEGLFDLKKLIPKNIRKVGLITAPGGAAIRDIEISLVDRVPIDDIILYPSLVQGQSADVALVGGIRYFNDFEPTDVIVITRGGGSTEDLMCFNSELLAREIFKSKIPVITAIGHEIDWTIADYVADLRLPTPTAVASFLSPLKRDAALRLDRTFRRILKNIILRLDDFEAKIKCIYSDVKSAVVYILSRKLSIFENLERRLLVFDRRKILRRGYALVRKRGIVVTRDTSLSVGDRLEVEIFGKKFDVAVL
ncbi:MAG: exodeoxyribonuclease VII large subunit [Rickettsiales bacterium]|jgi:exodeoxyribonuclease VII large subunit|nr:exodeoxyribonuclease VII large subunit [Rickettsiales bacterium]